MTDIQNDLTGRACDASPAARSCQSQCKPRFLTGRTHEHANRGCSPMFACSRRILPSPAEAGFKPPHSRLERNEDNRGLRPRGTLYFLAAKSTDRSLRLVLFAAFWSAKSGAKTDPPTKKAKRRGLTLAPGDYSRVCKQTVPSARAFSPHLSERLFCQAGVVRRGTWREGCVRNKQEAQKPTIAPGSGFKPPHSRLERNENNRKLACPEREAA